MPESEEGEKNPRLLYSEWTGAHQNRYQHDFASVLHGWRVDVLTLDIIQQLYSFSYPIFFICSPSDVVFPPYSLFSFFFLRKKNNFYLRFQYIIFTGITGVTREFTPPFISHSFPLDCPRLFSNSLHLFPFFYLIILFYLVHKINALLSWLYTWL